MQKKYYLFILLLLAALLEFWHLGNQPVKEYDEARYGINAFEMLQNKDFINLHYRGKPDAWVARPPLKAWLIIGGYEVLGYNEWGLRFSSGLSILLFFFFAFRLVNLYLPDKQAFICCMLLLSVKGIIAFHIGRNGDMDAELVALLTISTYYFLRFIDLNDNRAAWWAGLFLGLSFWLKTMACFYYVPGLLLYVLVSGKFAITLRNKALWKGLALFAAIVISWLMILQIYGSTYARETDGFHTYNNSLETMLKYDTWDRFTSSNFDKHSVETDRLFFIHSIDSVFNIWNYFFYAGVLLYLFHRFTPSRKNTFLSSGFYKICTLAICILIPIIILLTFGMHKLPWYTTPTVLFMAILATYAIHEISKIIPYTYPILALVFLFALGRHFLFLEDQIKETNEVFFLHENEELWKQADTILYIDPVPQNVYVYFLWQGKQLIPYHASTPQPHGIILGPQSLFTRYSGHLQLLARSNEEKHKQELFIARIKP
ncbi:MAG: arnT 1 [Chitinophagaceae bacterium]|nr:arnT 1 [Chitinophagaceae bacterium]